jgi:hypothetical protein
MIQARTVRLSEARTSPLDTRLPKQELRDIATAMVKPMALGIHLRQSPVRFQAKIGTRSSKKSKNKHETTEHLIHHGLNSRPFQEEPNASTSCGQTRGALTDVSTQAEVTHAAEQKYRHYTIKWLALRKAFLP